MYINIWKAPFLWLLFYGKIFSRKHRENLPAFALNLGPCFCAICCNIKLLIRGFICRCNSNCSVLACTCRVRLGKNSPPTFGGVKISVADPAQVGSGSGRIRVRSDPAQVGSGSGRIPTIFAGYGQKEPDTDRTLYILKNLNDKKIYTIFQHEKNLLTQNNIQNLLTGNWFKWIKESNNFFVKPFLN